jgi:FtsP/CotA-like multicopper oxidase with cupredoxin domain
MAGPDIIAIGTEGGILPNPVVIPSTPVNYEFNKRSVTVMNVMERGLYVGTAERADVIVDFSQYAGKTLILFNDSPAPLPAGDPRIDYYTDDGDQTGAGGAMNTVAGFGPNTRTVMQFVVSGTQNGTAFDIAPLQAALPAAYAASQEAPLIPEKAYNNAFLTNSGDNFATIYSGSSIQPNFVWTPTTTTAQTLQSIAVTGQGVGYTVAPTVVLSGAGLPTAGITINPVAGSAGAQVAGGKVTSVIIPAGLAATLSITSAPTVTFVSNKDALGVKVGGGATAQGFTNMTSSLPVKNKAIQELFDPSYGRMNATLGVELPFTSPLNQTTIPLGYIDPATEMLNDGEVQIWKITHNGVDTHPVHFHLVNLQVLNRVGWDGTIKPPYDDEQGWKETIKMNPLEDIYVAVKPRAPMLPFGIKESMRLMDPSQPSGSITGFTQVDPFTGVAPIDPKTGLTTQISNKEASYGWEYVWHCHILGHEENDFMRPIVFNFGAQLPNAPTPLSTTSTFAANTASKVVLNWVDPTPVTATTTPGNKQNEIGFKISRATGNSTTFTPVGTALANVTTFTDAAPATATGYTYKVVAYNSIGDGPAASLTWPGSSSTPLNCSGTKGIKTTNNGTAPNVMVVAPAITDVSLVGTAPNVTFTDKSNNESGFYVYRALVGASTCAYQQVANPGTNSSNSVTVKDTLITGNNALVAGATYRYAVQSYRIVTGKNPVTYISAPATFDFVFPGSLDVNGLTATANSMTTVTLSWTDNSLAETGYTITRNGGATFTPVTLSGHLGTGTVTYVDSTAVANTAYTYTVTATGTPANGTTASVSVTTPFDPAMTLAAPSNVMVQMTGANTAQVSFNDLASKETIYLVQVSTDSGKSWGDGTINTFTLGAPNAYVATLTRSNGSALIAGTGGAVTIGVPSNRNAANLTFTSGATPYLFRVAPAIGSPVNGTFTDAVALTTTNYTGATITTMGAWGNLATIDLSGMTIIAPPSAVIATASAAPKYGTVALSWVDNANNNASYLLEKSVDSGVTWTGTGVAIGGADTSATVTGLAAVPTVFRLKAVSLGKNASSFVSSNSVTPVALPLPAAPAKPSVTSGNAGGTVTARVNWTAVADAATYTVQWSTSATFATGATIKSGSANQTGTSYTLSAPTGVTGGTLVYFRIVAVNATGSSAPSLISNAATAQ